MALEFYYAEQFFDAIFEFLGQFTIRCIYYFSKKCWQFWGRVQKQANFWLGVQLPLKPIHQRKYDTGSIIDHVIFCHDRQESKQPAGKMASTMQFIARLCEYMRVMQC